ncbi:MAG: hypothetical protein ACP5HG_18275 [Anaerolineae bacterium]
MELYTQTTSLANELWVESAETPWPWQTTGPSVPGSKVPHLSVADELFIAAVANTPRPLRPWGTITQLSGMFQVSRPTIYALGKRAAEGLKRSVGGRPAKEQPPATAAEKRLLSDTIVVTPKRIARTALTMSFPGKMALRPMRQCLQEAFDQTRGQGTLSELLTQAGQRAGRVLTEIDYRPLGPVIALRDETYFQDGPILLVIEPLTSTILLGVVSEDAQAETWGASLLVSQDTGASLKGLVEDMARMYPKSQALAEMEVPTQKDVWHVENWGSQVRRTLEKQALAALRQVAKIEKQLLKAWDDAVFLEQYIPADEKAERLMVRHDTFACWLGHLCDALELVDLRSGEIRERAINGWLLEETLQAMETIDHPKVQKFVRSLRRHQDQLLTYLDWATEMLQPFSEMLAAHIPDPAQRHDFMRAIARSWRLRQALINGQRWRKRQADEAEAWLQLWLDENAAFPALATYLMNILDASGHASSLIECLNGLLKMFLHNRRAFRNRDTAQAYLNLFVLWHNMRVYERGKRAGKSPYQWAGIDPGTDDWLTLLGFPATD